MTPEEVTEYDNQQPKQDDEDEYGKDIGQEIGKREATLGHGYLPGQIECALELQQQ